MFIKKSILLISWRHPKLSGWAITSLALLLFVSLEICVSIDEQEMKTGSKCALTFSLPRKNTLLPHINILYVWISKYILRDFVRFWLEWNISFYGITKWSDVGRLLRVTWKPRIVWIHNQILGIHMNSIWNAIFSSINSVGCLVNFFTD